jgi:farnesyl-diphosphate farnesyltransferase
MQSTNPFAVASIFRDFARKIHRKATLKDPNYLAICVMTGKIECWVEHHYPSFVSISKESKTITLKTDDPRSEIVRRDRDLDKQRADAANKDAGAGAHDELGLAPWELFLLVLGAFGFVFVATALTTIGGLYYYYGNDWTWSMLGANTVGRFIEESKTTVMGVLGRDKKPYA